MNYKVKALLIIAFFSTIKSELLFSAEASSLSHFATANMTVRLLEMSIKSLQREQFERLNFSQKVVSHKYDILKRDQPEIKRPSFLSEAIIEEDRALYEVHVQETHRLINKLRAQYKGSTHTKEYNCIRELIQRAVKLAGDPDLMPVDE